MKSPTVKTHEGYMSSRNGKKDRVGQGKVTVGVRTFRRGLLIGPAGFSDHQRFTVSLHWPPLAESLNTQD